MSDDPYKSFDHHIKAQEAEITLLRARIAELEDALGDLLRCTEKHVFGDECKAQRDKARVALGETQ